MCLSMINCKRRGCAAGLFVDRFIGQLSEQGELLKEKAMVSIMRLSQYQG